jgi:transposase-like protein
MNLITIFSKFPDQEACIEFLERVRWGSAPYCPHCGATNVARKADNGRVGRWNCHGCTSSFNVLAQTIFEKTRLPLQKWFLAIGIILNAKKSVSSCQLARDLDLNQKSAWYMQQRIRAAMLTEEGDLLQGIIEADETYVGGKPRKGNYRDDDTPSPRGRATKKVAVVGVVERGGRVAARVADDLTGKGLLRFLRSVADPNGSLLMTDELAAYNEAGKVFRRSVINHSKAYAVGQIHTNTIEGFWSLLKRAWYGSHHHYSKKYMPLFVGEACWKYNQRRNADPFATFMKGCFA